METLSDLPLHRLNDHKANKLLAECLNKVYCLKTHMLSYFSALSAEIRYGEVCEAVSETITDIEKQINRLDQIFELLDIQRTETGCGGIVALLDELVDTIADPYEDVALRDFRILIYLQNLEGIEVASFKTIKMLARRATSTTALRLIEENLDEARADQNLLRVMTERCVGISR